MSHPLVTQFLSLFGNASSRKPSTLKLPIYSFSMNYKSPREETQNFPHAFLPFLFAIFKNLKIQIKLQIVSRTLPLFLTAMHLEIWSFSSLLLSSQFKSFKIFSSIFKSFPSFETPILKISSSSLPKPSFILQISKIFPSPIKKFSKWLAHLKLLL